MKYKEYIDLGFERTDMEDQVEFKETGYYGFSLEKVLSDRVRLGVSSGELDKPKLYIKKSSGCTNHIIYLTGEMVKDLLAEPEPVKSNPFCFA